MRYILLPILFLLACTEPVPKQDPVEQIVGNAAEGVFRGNDMGDAQAEVLAREAEHVVYNMPDELTCRIPLDMKDSTFYDITYNFSDVGLYVIELDIFPGSQKMSTDLFERFRGYYDRRFGVSSVDDGFTMWNTRSTRGTNIEISMIDEGREAGMPYISVTFFETEID